MVPRSLRRLIMPADTRDRHVIVAKLCGTPDRVLDVGGVAGELELFLPGSQVTVLNVEGRADRIFDGATLPYPDRSFDVATSLDVLEHIPSPKREQHLRELARVARRLVLCCPLGSAGHLEAERQLSAWYRGVTGEPHRYLEEHLERGLPDSAELERLASAAGLEFELLYHGDYREVNRVFRLSVEARRRPRALLSYAAARVRRGRPGDLQAEPGPATNRVFLVASVAEGEPDGRPQ
jgi:methyltransferase family protein